MKVLVVMESIFGNTRDIAEAIAAGLRDTGHTVDVVEAGEAVDAFSAGRFDEGDADVVVIGGPTHAWGMTRPATRADARKQAPAHHVDPVSAGAGIREWISVVAPHLHTRRAVTFDTAAVARIPVGSAARRAAAALKRLGFTLVVEPAQFRVSGTAGPLVEGEGARARRFGVSVGEKLALAGRVDAPAAPPQA